MPALLEKLKQLNSSTPEIIEVFLKLGNFQSLKKGTLIPSIRHEFPTLYFIENGIVRSYINHNNEQLTYWIKSEGFILPSRGLLSNLKNNENLQFLTDSLLWSIDLIKVENPSISHEKFHKVLLEIYEYNLFESKSREQLLRLTSAKERYLHLKNNHPFLLYNLKIDILSSYLKISPRHFRRLKDQDIRL